MTDYFSKSNELKMKVRLNLTELIFDTLVGFVAGFLTGAGFYLVVRFYVSNLDHGIAVDSLGPDAGGDIKIHTYEVEYEGEEGHLGMFEERDDHSDTDDDHGREECNLGSDIGLHRLEYRVPEPTSDHDDHELADREIEEYLVLVFDLDGDFVLQEVRE